MINEFLIKIDGDQTEISTSNELLAVLDVLQGNHDREVLEQLAENLCHIITDAKGLQNILSVLCMEDQLYLIKSLGSHLVKIIGKAGSLRDLLAFISEDEIEAVLISLLGKSGLRQLIGNALELAETLEWVYGKSDQIILDLIETEYIKNIVKTGYDLSIILHCLNPGLQARLIADLGLPFIDHIIHEKRDFAYLMRALPAGTSLGIINLLTSDKIKDIFCNKRDLEYLNRYMDSEEMNNLKNKLKELNNAS